MISIIVCSIKPSLLESLKLNINETVGVPYEIIAIDNRTNRYSLAGAYNEAAKQATHDILCFVHEDIIFHTKGWGRNVSNHLAGEKVRLLGILGCVVKTSIPSNVYIPNSSFNRQNQLQRYPDESIHYCYENPLNDDVSEVITLDGMFICCKKQVWSETKFSEGYLNGFHGYDIDFSLKNSLLGRNIVVYDILLEHLSFGNFNKEWIDTQYVVSRVWKKQLPIKVDGVSSKNLKNAEFRNTNELLKLLIRHQYSKRKQLSLLLLALTNSLANPFLPYFIRKIFLPERVDRILKELLKTS